MTLVVAENSFVATEHVLERHVHETKLRTVDVMGKKKEKKKREEEVSRLITREDGALITPWRFLIKLRLISNPLAEGE